MIRYNENRRSLTLTNESDSYFFEPKHDITPMELALCLTPLLLERADLVGALLPVAQRHFRREPSYGPQRMNTVAPDPALMERTNAKLQELAAVTGKELPPGVWVSIGTPWLVTEDHEFAVAVRLRNREVQG